MELSQKLQELRKQKGLTQEELASALYVSRTAISKWESGRGYPNIDSLKAIADFFSVTIDELLSGSEVLSLAKEEQRQRNESFRDLIFGLLDLSMALLLFLPFFAGRADGAIHSTALLFGIGLRTYLKVFYFLAVILTSICGVLTLALQALKPPIWEKAKRTLSLSLGVTSALLFIVSLQPNAAVFAFVLLAIKVLCLFKR